MKHRMFSVFFSIILLMTACAPSGASFDVSSNEQALTDSTQTTTNQVETKETTKNSNVETTFITETTTVSETTTSASTTAEPEKQTTPFSLSDIPPFSNTPYCEVNNNKPFFTDDEITTQSYEYYPDLDSLGRCGACIACISLDMMPTTEREGIGMVKPSGWHLDKYDFVDGKYLFNRCHLIGYQLTGENANLSNLITGTRYMNIQGMLPFENKTAGYIRSTGNHVMYRTTPVFDGDNLVATGVLMEAYSVEDNGQGICFNVFCYNVQPGVLIDYANGENQLDESSEIITLDPFVEDSDEPPVIDRGLPDNSDEQSQSYI